MSFHVKLERVCFFLDLDGTLLDYAERPDEVIVHDGVVDTLAGLAAATRGAMAVISGRPIRELDGLLRPLRFAAAGVHGAEIRARADAPIVAALDRRLPEALWRALLSALPRASGVLAENKQYAFAVHYRAAPQLRSTLVANIHQAVALSGVSGVEILEGRFVIEIKTAARNKGDAVAFFCSEPEFAGRQPIYIGDDVTDLPGFAAATQAGGVACSVGAPMAGATCYFEDAAAVRAWLTKTMNDAHERRIA